jgi:hypothetical protein
MWRKSKFKAILVKACSLPFNYNFNTFQIIRNRIFLKIEVIINHCCENLKSYKTDNAWVTKIFWAECVCVIMYNTRKKKTQKLSRQDLNPKPLNF